MKGITVAWEECSHCVRFRLEAGHDLRGFEEKGRAIAK